MKPILAVLFILYPLDVFAGGRWERSPDADTRAVVNCLVDHWLRAYSFAHVEMRYELHVKVVPDSGDGAYAEPQSVERLPDRGGGHENLFCGEGRQTDYYSTLFRNKSLVLSNGKSARNGQTEGFAFGVMPAYRNGKLLAIYLQSGSWSSRKMKSGEDCVYDATNHANRLYFLKKSASVSLIGDTNLWVADVGLPNCMREFTPEYFAGSPQAKSRVSSQAK